MDEKLPTRRRWFQFSLRTFLIVSLLIGLGCGWIGMQLQKKRRHEAVVNEILKLGGRVTVLDKNLPAWKEWLFGSYAVAAVHLSLTDTDPTDALLSQIQGMELVSLDLSSSNVTDAGLAHLKRISKLKLLNLNNTQVTDAELIHLNELTSLAGLYLGNTQITDAGLTHVTGLPSLSYLDLGNTQATQAGVDELQKAIPGCTINYSPRETTSASIARPRP